MADDSLLFSFRRRKKPYFRGVVFSGLLVIILFWLGGNFFYQSSFGFLGGKFNELIFQFQEKKIFLSENSLKQELETVKEENIRLNQENLKIKEKLQNEQTNFSAEEALKDFSLKEVSVIGNDNFLDTPSLIILGGENNQIQDKMAVINQKGVLIGLIKQSQAEISQVVLLNNNNSRLGAKIAGTDWDGVVEGNRNLRAILTMLPVESEVKKGDEVITDNRNPLIPSGLLLGTVSDIKESEDHLFKEAVLDLPYESKKLTKVWVVIGRNNL